MGLTPKEIKATTLKEFSLALQGYERRQEREWDRTRHILAFQLNYGGMGSKEYYSPQAIFPLPMDEETIKRMITTKAQALLLLKEFQSLCHQG